MVFVCILSAIFGASIVLASHSAIVAVTRSNEVFKQYLAQDKELTGLKEQHREVLGRHAGLSRAIQSIATVAKANPQFDMLLRAQNIYLTAPEGR